MTIGHAIQGAGERNAAPFFPAVFVVDALACCSDSPDVYASNAFARMRPRRSVGASVRCAIFMSLARSASSSHATVGRPNPGLSGIRARGWGLRDSRPERCLACRAGTGRCCGPDQCARGARSGGVRGAGAERQVVGGEWGTAGQEIGRWPFTFIGWHGVRGLASRRRVSPAGIRRRPLLQAARAAGSCTRAEGRVRCSIAARPAACGPVSPRQ